MLTKENIKELSVTDRVILSKFLDNVAEGIKQNLKTMDISGFGASYSSGRSSEFEIKETVNGAQLWGMDYLFELENPLTPQQQQAKSYSSQWAGIRDWIGEKPILFEGDIHHCASNFFGTTNENSRLAQVFFINKIDANKESSFPIRRIKTHKL